MVSAQSVLVPEQARLIPARDCWWFLGPGGTARLRPHQVGPDGSVLPATERSLRAAGLYDARPIRSYALTVLTSTSCNLGCGYCFQNAGQDPDGGTRPPRIRTVRLTSERIGRVLEFTRGRMAAAGLDRLSVTLFGGEPLLNLRGARELLLRARDLGPVTAGMVSNGTLLTPLVARDLAAAGLRSVQITFDGDRDTHDAIRVRRSGGGTFDTIVDNVAGAMAAAPALRWQLRVNVTHLNRSGIDDLVERLAARLAPEHCGIHFTPVGDVGIGFGNELRYDETLAEDFIRWHGRARELGFDLPRPRLSLGCPTCRFKDGRFGAVVNADGVLSSCWETAGKPGWDVGTVDSGYRPAAETEDRWTTCEAQYQYENGAAASLHAFQDRVDAALLTSLHGSGRP